MQAPLGEHFWSEETNPHLAVQKETDEKIKSAYDLVEKVMYLYVQVVKAKDLPQKEAVGTYVEVNLGNFKGKTFLFEKQLNPEWSQVFTFIKDHIQSSVLEANVMSKRDTEDHFMGRVLFHINDVSSGTLHSPQWYRLEDKNGNTCNGQLMFAAWWGTQADEAFAGSWHISAATSSHATGLSNIRSKVYYSPKLWYLKVNVIEAKGLMATPKTFVKAILGNHTLRTKNSISMSMNPMWNDDLMFVAAEPFEESIILTVEDNIAPNKDEVLGRCEIRLECIDTRLDQKPLKSKWFNLVNDAVIMERGYKETGIAKIHLRICFEGGYHVFDESTSFSSDFRPSEKKLWKSSIGVLEVGFLGATSLQPMKIDNGGATTNAYCVAKYGQKWIRTRTIINSFSPKWNEQYTWEVCDPCTVITIGVFDNCFRGGDEASSSKDLGIGKVRIRLSTLETNRVYTKSFPLLWLHPSGLKKMGEIHLALRFSCFSLLNTIQMYSQPMLPKLHYVNPLTVTQIDRLKYQANCIVSMKLSCTEPPLQKQVVHFMLDSDTHMWSMRRSKAAFFRIFGVLGGLFAVARWFEGIRYWKNPITTILVHILFLMLVLYPELFLPTIFLYLFFIGVNCYRWRPRHPPHMDTRLSCADTAHPDELDEEFDTFPTSRADDIVKMRYDRLRSVASRIQTLAEDVATLGEKLQSLLSWRDPRATALTLVFCLVAAIVLYYALLQVALVTVFYILRHPVLRRKRPLPCLPVNFLRRLPAKNDCML